MEVVRVRRFCGALLLESPVLPGATVDELREEVAEALNLPGCSVFLVAVGSAVDGSLEDGTILRDQLEFVASGDEMVAEVEVLIDETDTERKFLSAVGVSGDEADGEWAASSMVEAAITLGRQKCRGINVTHAKLRGLPSCIGILHSLRWIRAGGNRLRRLPDEIGDLRSLETLQLPNNQLSRLPDSVCRLRRLNILDVQDNRLVGLPEDIGQLTNLQVLRCDRNQITTLPESFCDLLNLKVAMLQGNGLKELPDRFGARLEKLQALDLGRSSLARLPSAFSALRNFERLYLEVPLGPPCRQDAAAKCWEAPAKDSEGARWCLPPPLLRHIGKMEDQHCEHVPDACTLAVWKSLVIDRYLWAFLPQNLIGLPTVFDESPSHAVEFCMESPTPLIEVEARPDGVLRRRRVLLTE